MIKQAINRIGTHASLLAGLYLVVLGLSSALAYYAPTNISTVTTIAALKALGTSSSQFTNIYVLNYASAGDGGGGMLTWKSTSTATADNCLTFQATGVTTGRWVRLLNGAAFNVDMCGTHQTDDSTAFNNALAVCHTQRIPLVFSAYRYLLNHNLVAEPDCSFNGAGINPPAGTQPNGTALDFKSDTDGGTCIDIVHSATPYGSYFNGTDVGNFSIWGATSGLLIDEHCQKGLSISRINGEYLHDLQAFYILGPGIFIGETILSTCARCSVFGSGIAGGGSFEVDGEVSAGTEYFGTTLLLEEVDVGTASPNVPQAGIMIDSYTNVTMLNGTSENAGISLEIGGKVRTVQGLSNILIMNADFETPSGGASTCIRIGNGWGGGASLGAVTVTLFNNTCVANGTVITSQIIAKNTDAFYAYNNLFEAGNAGYLTYNFQGTGNTHESVFLDHLQGTPGAYVTVNGAAMSDAQVFLPWFVDQEPVAVGSLPACNAANKARRLYVTDANATLTAGIGAIVAAGGANIVPVGCNGTNWRIGG